MKRRSFLLSTGLVLLAPLKATQASWGESKQKSGKGFRPCKVWTRNQFLNILEEIAEGVFKDQPGVLVGACGKDCSENACVLVVEDKYQDGFVFAKMFSVNDQEWFDSFADFQQVVEFWVNRAWKEREKVSLFAENNPVVFERPEKVA